MKPLVFAYLGTLVSFLVIDGLWLGLVAKNFYRDQLGNLMLPSPHLGVAAVFYLIFAAALVFLAVRPGLDTGSMMTAVGYGAVLGRAAYGTYDLSNLSTLKGWPAALTLVDMAWGTVLTAIASATGYPWRDTSHDRIKGVRRSDVDVWPVVI